MFVENFLYCLWNEKKKIIKIFGPKTWCKKKPLGHTLLGLNWIQLKFNFCPGHKKLKNPKRT